MNTYTYSNITKGQQKRRSPPLGWLRRHNDVVHLYILSMVHFYTSECTCGCVCVCVCVHSRVWHVEVSEMLFLS